MPDQPGKSIYRRVGIKPLALGINDAKSPTLLEDGQTPDCRNVDFNHESIQAHGGVVKFNNQPAPHAGILTAVGYQPISVASGISVPQRGYAFLPYDAAHDLGGDFVYDGAAHTPLAWSFHARRGRSFSFSCSFRLPQEDRLYHSKTGAGVHATPSSGMATYDEAFDECTIIAQKGGDGYSPMSWALGIVNTGDLFETVTGDAASDRVSNYALVFMWLDLPAWGAYSPAVMRYKVGSGSQANVGTAGRYCTMAYRAIVAKAFVEPGQDYHVGVNLSLDTGSPGTGADPTASWNANGTFEITLRDQRNTVTRCNTSGTNLFVWKGPTDSFDYLTRYGVRFFGRDPMFLGLGYRFTPWAGQGFIPCGLDSASMEMGGFRMLDVSANAAPSAYSAHVCTSVSGTGVLNLNWLAMHAGTISRAPNPTDPTESGGTAAWYGLGDGAGVIYDQGTAGRSEALRNYCAVMWKDGSAAYNGARMLIDYYYESLGAGFFSLRSTPLVNWTNKPYFIQAFRWHQRRLALSNFRIWTSARDMSDERVQFSLASYSLAKDETEPGQTSLVAAWPLDDAGGGVLRETVSGRKGYLAPYSLGRDSDGLFLSGEGEALCIDFSENPAMVQGLKHMLSSHTSGFAIEIRCVIPQAYYSRCAVDATYRYSTGAPIMGSWEVKDDSPGMTSTARPLLRFGHRQRLALAYGTGPFHFPCGFNAEYGVSSDQTSTDLSPLVQSWAGGTTPNYSVAAPWVGREIRIQVGVQSSGTDDNYTAYMAMSPKDAINPAEGDPADAEFAFYASTTIPMRDLARSVVVIGGAWAPGSLASCEVNARMIVRDVRVFGAAAPGALPSASGSITTAGTGKLLGSTCLPATRLHLEDLLLDVGPTLRAANVTDESTSIAPASGARFYTGEPEATNEALKETYLLVSKDRLKIWKDDNLPTEQEDFYWVSSVAAGGASATLAKPFSDRSMDNAWAASFRVIGYTALTDDISTKPLSISQGSPFVTGTAVPSDATLTGRYFTNVAPVTAEWVLRVFSGASSVRDVVPTWTRGAAIPRENPVLGLAGHQGRLFAATRGCLYEADDRWREDGPTDDISECIEVSASLTKPGTLFPKQGDLVRFTTATAAKITTSGLLANPRHYDAWIKLDSHAKFQTVLWVGTTNSNPSISAGTTTGTHKCHVWLRLADGHPEIAVGSTANHGGATRPEHGLFVARSSARVQLGVWTHIRWTLEGAASGVWVASAPKIFVNGISSAVTVMSTESGAAAGQWVSVANLSLATGMELLLGCARDAYALAGGDGTFTESALTGELLRPNEMHGYMHALGGLLSVVAITNAATASSFNPMTLTYSGATFLVLASPEGVGHKIYDSGGAQYGVIESHPAVSLFHEMGMGEQPASWAPYGARLFVTTGGRPVYVQDR